MGVPEKTGAMNRGQTPIHGEDFAGGGSSETDRAFAPGQMAALPL